MEISEKDLINLKEFVELGLLQEINRQFLHPLGLSLLIKLDDSEMGGQIVGIYDSRETKEGITFNEEKLSKEKQLNVAKMLKERQKERKKLFGCTIQPIKRND